MLGVRIAALRRQTGLSQKALADALEVSPSAVGMYEQGRRTPAMETLMRMAELFGVSMDFLLTGRSTERCDVQQLRLMLQRTQELLGGRLRLQTETGEVRELEPRDLALLLSVAVSE